jgi:hypothetical protein
VRFAFEFSRDRQVDKAAPPPGAPPGTVATALTVDSPVAPGGIGAMGASPGAGMRPEPGAVPVQTEPKKDTPTDQPLRYVVPYGANATFTVRQGLTPFEILRRLADVHDTIRTCIETRKDQICDLTWDFRPRDQNRQRALTAGEKSAVDRARAFFAKPDKRRNWQTWLRMAIEEILSIDALSIFKRRTRGGQLYALELKDGSTIRPLVDATGDTPLPPQVAYQQIIYGQPMKGGDCTTVDLLYRPRTVRVHSPYGLSPTEAVLLTVNAALNRQMFNLSYYSDGNIPEGLMDAPGDWTAEQIRQFQDYFDAFLSGNLSARRRLKIVGKGMAGSVHEFKQPSFETDFDLWMLQVVCASFAIAPAEIGFTQDVNKATGEAQERMQYRRMKPLANFIKGILDEVLQDETQNGGLGLPDFEAYYEGGEVKNALIDTTITEKRVKLGIESVDDVRLREGKDAIGLGPMVWTNEGPVFVEQLIARKNADPDDSDPLDPNRPGKDLSHANTAPAKEAKAADVEDDDPAEKAISAELRLWRGVAIKAAKAGKVRSFTSDVIPPGLRTHVEATIREVAGETPSVAGVVKAFELIEKDRADDRLRRRFQVRYQRSMGQHFARQGEALAAHLEAGIAALES